MMSSTLGSEPLIGPLLREARPDGKIRGTMGERFFFRAGTGAGWALLGDAGHHKDFVIGDGITEALLQARSLALAIEEGSDAALLHWWRARDVAALPWYFLGKELGAPGPMPELQRMLFARLGGHTNLIARIMTAADTRRLPVDLALAGYVARWTLAAAIGGRPQVLAELVAAATRAASAYRELRARRSLLLHAAALTMSSRRV
jgi:hypothetical protein